MSDAWTAELYERLSRAKAKNATADRVFLRGWNAAIDFSIKQMKLTCDEPVEADKDVA
jgi:hypothetical protein